MKKVVNVVCLALMFVFFSCENKPAEREYNIKNGYSQYCQGLEKYEVIIDNIVAFEYDENNVLLNKRNVNSLLSLETKAFVVSSSVEKVLVVYRYREMRENGSPNEIIYMRTQEYTLFDKDVITVTLGYDTAIPENEFYELIN